MVKHPDLREAMAAYWNDASLANEGQMKRVYHQRLAHEFYIQGIESVIAWYNAQATQRQLPAIVLHRSDLHLYCTFDDVAPGEALLHPPLRDWLPDVDSNHEPTE